MLAAVKTRQRAKLKWQRLAASVHNSADVRGASEVTRFPELWPWNKENFFYCILLCPCPASSSQRFIVQPCSVLLKSCVCACVWRLRWRGLGFIKLKFHVTVLDICIRSALEPDRISKDVSVMLICSFVSDQILWRRRLEPMALYLFDFHNTGCISQSEQAETEPHMQRHDITREFKNHVWWFSGRYNFIKRLKDHDWKSTN